MIFNNYINKKFLILYYKYFLLISIKINKIYSYLKIEKLNILF